MCTCFSFVGVTMNSFNMSLLKIMLVSIEGALRNIMYLVPCFLTNNISIKPHTFLAVGGRPWPWLFDMIVSERSEFNTNSLMPFLFKSFIPLIVVAMSFLSTC